MAVTTWSPGQVLAAQDLNDTFASKVDYATPTNAQTGTAYTFVADDAERITTASNGSAVTFTIPPQSSVTWGDDTILRVVNYGAGAVTVAGGSGVTVTNTAETIDQYAAAAAYRTGSDAWTLVPFGRKKLPPTSVEYLVIAGGGGGGNTNDTRGGGGGGAGGYRCSVTGENSGGGASAESPLSITAGTTYTITIGAGGSTTSSGSTSGNDSVFGSITATKGGRGAGRQVSPATQAPESGGSGGGGYSSGSGTTNTGASGTANQGYAGGSVPLDTVNSGGGGGGGAGGTGGANSTGTGGAGGSGVSSSISGSSVARAGGGGGGSGNTAAGTASAGGGAGGASGGNATSGTANTGGGGGGAGQLDTVPGGGNGGSGVVIIRHATTSADAVSTTGSPTITSSGGYRIYTFTGSGTITW